MITASDFYKVISAVVPLYVAMILAYGSVRWWKILSPDQCSGINRFVAIFAVPLLSFEIIANNNPYEMSPKFIAADVAQKVLTLVTLGLWAKLTKKGSLDWLITLFMLATLPNTLVMGIPLLDAMYRPQYGGLVVQAVVLQCIVWYTLLLFLYEYRSAKILILEQFPETAASIVSFTVDPDVVSLDGRNTLKTEAEIRDNGMIHVIVKRSTTSSQSQDVNSFASPIRSSALASVASSKAVTPRASNLTGAEIYSLQSSTNLTPRESSLDHSDFCLIMSNRSVGSTLADNAVTSDIICSHRGNCPRLANTYMEYTKPSYLSSDAGNANSNGFPFVKQSLLQGITPLSPIDSSFETVEDNQMMMRGSSEEQSKLKNYNGMFSTNALQISKRIGDEKGSSGMDSDARELHMFVWSSSSASPVSDRDKHALEGIDYAITEVAKYEYEPKDANIMIVPPHDDVLLAVAKESKHVYEDNVQHNFSFAEEEVLKMSLPLTADAQDSNILKRSPMTLAPRSKAHPGDLPPRSVMVKLILDMVWRKLIRNPNTYASLLGLVWSLISYRWHVGMPIIIEKSIKILSNAGLGMAMFSLGLFMALQSRILACGTSLAVLCMMVRFITGPAVMAATSIAVGLRSTSLRASIVQASLPQGIVPFVFAKEYNLHPDILSTAVIFGMLISLPINLVYFLVLGL